MFFLAAIGSTKYRIEVESSLCADKAQCVLKNLKKMMTLRHDDDDSFIRAFFQTK